MIVAVLSIIGCGEGTVFLSFLHVYSSPHKTRSAGKKTATERDTRRERMARGRQRGMGSFVACLGRLTSDRSSRARRSTKAMNGDGGGGHEGALSDLPGAPDHNVFPGSRLYLEPCCSRWTRTGILTGCHIHDERCCC